MEDRGPRLDPALWEQLPLELTMRILGKLPLRSLLIFRSVCSGWKVMIDSAQVVYDGPPGKPVVFYHHPGGILETDEEQDDWVVETGEQLSRPFLAFPNSWDRQMLPFADFENVYTGYHETSLLAADGGLLCFSRWDSNDTLTVYNPLSRRWRSLKLPSPVFQEESWRRSVYMSALGFALIGLSVDQETGNYKLVVAGIEKTGLTETQIYESGMDVWKTAVVKIPATMPDEQWSTGKGVACAGSIYWHVSKLCYEDDGENHHIFHGLLKFDMLLESWTFVRQCIPSEPESLFHLHVVEHRGKVLLLEWCDRVYSEEEVTEEAIELLTLGPEVKLMDNRLTELTDHFERWKPIRGVGQGDALYIVFKSTFPGDESADDALRVLVYNEIVWLNTYEPARDENLFYAFAPTLRAYV